MARLLSLILLSFLSLLPSASAESRDLSLTIVYDNNPFRGGLETRWGSYSCIVIGAGKRFEVVDAFPVPTITED